MRQGPRIGRAPARRRQIVRTLGDLEEEDTDDGFQAIRSGFPAADDLGRFGRFRPIGFRQRARLGALPRDRADEAGWESRCFRRVAPESIRVLRRRRPGRIVEDRQQRDDVRIDIRRRADLVDRRRRRRSDRRQHRLRRHRRGESPELHLPWRRRVSIERRRCHLVERRPEGIRADRQAGRPSHRPRRSLRRRTRAVLR